MRIFKLSIFKCLSCIHNRNGLAPAFELYMYDVSHYVTFIWTFILHVVHKGVEVHNKFSTTRHSRTYSTFQQYTDPELQNPTILIPLSQMLFSKRSASVIDGSEKRNGWLNLEVQSPYVIERRSKLHLGGILKQFYSIFV